MALEPEGKKRIKEQGSEKRKGLPNPWGCWARSRWGKRRRAGACSHRLKYKKGHPWCSKWQPTLATLSDHGCRGSFGLEILAISLGSLSHHEENRWFQPKRNKSSPGRGCVLGSLNWRYLTETAGQSTKTQDWVFRGGQSWRRTEVRLRAGGHWTLQNGSGERREKGRREGERSSSGRGALGMLPPPAPARSKTLVRPSKTQLPAYLKALLGHLGGSVS